MRSLTKRGKAAATIAAIRARYPNPIARPSLINNEYCVSVAVFRCHPEIWCQIGLEVRRKIINDNDAGAFEGAWKLVEDALAQE